MSEKRLEDYPQPSVTVDVVLFGYDAEELKVLLIRRGVDPFSGAWALPGGFVRMDESLDQAAHRELSEETGVEEAFLEQLYSYGDVGRDPRGRVISVAYYALVALLDHSVRAATDAAEAAWFSVWDLPTLAFDHARIVQDALARLKGKVRYQPVGFELLPERFPLSQLQHLYETILERPLDKRNFRKKLKKMEFLIETDEVQKDVAHRAARLFRFDPERYQALRKEGFHFEI